VRTEGLDRVEEIIREVSASVIEPRFTVLDPDEIHEKSPGELVTVADQEAERLLTRRLGEILPGVPVVGEEATAADPALVHALDGRQAWLVDPLDGTSNFIAGSPDWAVMVALVETGATLASWIWRPSDHRMYRAERGMGATCNGVPLRRAVEPATAKAELRGEVLTRFLDRKTAAAVERNRRDFGCVTNGRLCAGVDYPLLAEGDIDFVLFWRTLPWDHAPGVLLAEEAGATVGRLDGTPYYPTQTSVGLLAAANTFIWGQALTLLD
jgi:fructose-1,6-bisphosphatase/inositol monophosphatase family enzyme